jgi:hypothetical protein
MSFEPLPQRIEQGVSRYAEQQHISHDEAVLELIETGLQLVLPTQNKLLGKNPAEELIGLFSSPDDWVFMDEVVTIAYEGRKAAASREFPG